VSDENAQSNQVLVYQAENGKIRVEVRFERETVWLSQAQLADLYQTTAQHIREIYEDEECDAEATCKENRSGETP